MNETKKVKDEPEIEQGPECIVVVQNGFVYVGHVTLEDGSMRISEAYNIRRWGTTKGLGQLAIEGKQKETLLDYCGVVRVPFHSILFTIDSTFGLLP